MRRLACCLALLASLAFVVCPVVEAADSALKGTVKEVDTAIGMVVLEDGTELRITSGEIMAKIHEGDNVEVVFEEKDGQKVVSSVEVTGR
jgi:Cu/Ag efflux protein CusF